MKTSLRLFLGRFVVLTCVIAVNRWDLPLTTWLCVIFGLVMLLSGSFCIAEYVG